MQNCPQGTDKYLDKADGMTYDRQRTVQVEVRQPEMATVRVQVSWQGALAYRAVIVSAKTPLADPPES